jgi:hypothetical protein
MRLGSAVARGMAGPATPTSSTVGGRRANHPRAALAVGQMPSTITQELLGWKPTPPGLIEGTEQGHYFT